MSNKNVKELVKNVIEENAVAFKENLNRTLYGKVGQKLQEKYVELSQNIFEMANVEVAAAEASGTVGDTNAQTTTPGTQGENSPTYSFPDYKRFLKEGPSAVPDPKWFFPNGLSPTTAPSPYDYPLGQNDPQFKADYAKWNAARLAYNQALRNHENWKKGQANKERSRTATKKKK